MLTIRVVIGLSLQGMQIGSSINPQVCRLNGLVRCSTLISAGNSNSLPPYSKFRWSSTSYSKFRQLPFCFIRTTLMFLFFSSIRRISSCTNFFRRFSFVVPHLGVVVYRIPVYYYSHAYDYLCLTLVKPLHCSLCFPPQLLKVITCLVVVTLYFVNVLVLNVIFSELM